MAVEWSVRAREGCWLVGVAGSGPHATGQQWVRELWRTLLATADHLPQTLDRDMVVSASHGRETEFTCYLGFTAPEPVELPATDGVVQIEILPRDYAVAAISGSQDDVIEAYMGADTWAHDQGRQVNHVVLGLEHYREALRPVGEPVDVEIWIPLV